MQKKSYKALVTQHDENKEKVFTLLRQEKDCGELEIDGRDSGTDLTHKIQLIIPGSEYLSDKYSILKDENGFNVKAILNETL